MNCELQKAKKFSVDANILQLWVQQLLLCLLIILPILCTVFDNKIMHQLFFSKIVGVFCGVNLLEIMI